MEQALAYHSVVGSVRPSGPAISTTCVPTGNAILLSLKRNN